MKQIAAIFFLFFTKACFSQDTEFGVSNNGLIYSDSTVKQLKLIVDSLNLKFKVCDLNKTYQSKPQAKAHFVSLEKGKIKEAKLDMDNNISFDDFIKKYNESEVEKEFLVIKFKYKNYKNKDVIEFSTIAFGDKYEHNFDFEKNLKLYEKPLKGRWIYKYYEKDEYTEESIDAFYFTEEFTQQPIPDLYARMILYSDCMVDTSTQVFYENAHVSGFRFRGENPSKAKDFMDYIHKSTYRPEYSREYKKEEYEIYVEKCKVWESLRLYRVDSLQKNDRKFNVLLNEAVQDAINGNGTDDEFEEYVGRYYSRKTELELKRNRRVVGSCSADNSPRVHALNIAILSAETINWEIFLRSHLDIMNDRFERVSDGSYAWDRRKTYIKEIEIIDINVLDLLLGISLRIENPSKNHYYGSISRLGRALSETNKLNEIEAKMLQMISDKQLDDYNRVLIYYLFINYNYNLEDKQRQALNKEKLLTAINVMPEYLAKKMTVE